MKKVIFIIGPTGSGKNYVMDYLKEINCKIIPSYTTRELRKDEISGENYVTLPKHILTELHETGKLIEYVRVGDIEYGISESVFNNYFSTFKIPVFIVKADGFKQIVEHFKSVHLKCKLDILFLDIPRVERFNNLLKQYKNLSKKLATEKALDRLVRGGDTISNEFKDLINNDVNLLRGMDYTINTISSKKDLDKYISGIKYMINEKVIFSNADQ